MVAFEPDARFTVTVDETARKITVVRTADMSVYGGRERYFFRTLRRTLFEELASLPLYVSRPLPICKVTSDTISVSMIYSKKKVIQFVDGDIEAVIAACKIVIDRLFTVDPAPDSGVE